MTRLDKINQLQKIISSLQRERCAEGSKLARLWHFVNATPRAIKEYKQDFRELPFKEQLIIKAQMRNKETTIEIITLRIQMLEDRKSELLFNENK